MIRHALPHPRRSVPLVGPDGTLHFGPVQTIPSARPAVGDILTALDFVLERDRAARGEVGDDGLEGVELGAGRPEEAS